MWPILHLLCNNLCPHSLQHHEGPKTPFSHYSPSCVREFCHQNQPNAEQIFFFPQAIVIMKELCPWVTVSPFIWGCSLLHKNPSHFLNCHLDWSLILVGARPTCQQMYRCFCFSNSSLWSTERNYLELSNPPFFNVSSRATAIHSISNWGFNRLFWPLIK